MHLRRLIVLITYIRNIINHQRSCTPTISVVGQVSLHRTAVRCVIRKKTNYHVAKLFLPEGVGSNGTTSDLFTMSKYPAVDPIGSTQPNSALSHVAFCPSPFELSSHGLLALDLSTGQIDLLSANRLRSWWSQTGSNRRHPACKAGALPAELWPQTFKMVGPGGLEPPTSRLSGVRSNHLSYGPPGIRLDWTIKSSISIISRSA